MCIAFLPVANVQGYFAQHRAQIIVQLPMLQNYLTYFENQVKSLDYCFKFSFS